MSHASDYIEDNDNDFPLTPSKSQKDDLVKKLREETGAGFLACRHSLECALWDYGAAVEILKHRGEC